LVLFLLLSTSLSRDIQNILQQLPPEYAEQRFTINITGSAGMGLAERIHLPFVREAIALSKTIRTFYKDFSTFIELGGEDAKIVLFSEHQAPEMKINGCCAGKLIPVSSVFHV